MNHTLQCALQNPPQGLHSELLPQMAEQAGGKQSPAFLNNAILQQFCGAGQVTAWKAATENWNRRKSGSHLLMYRLKMFEDSRSSINRA